MRFNFFLLSMQLYLITEPFTGWFLLMIGAVFTIVAFRASKDNKEEKTKRFDRMFLMSGIFAAIGLLLLMHFYTRGSIRAVNVAKEAYKFPVLFKK